MKKYEIVLPKERELPVDDLHSPSMHWFALWTSQNAFDEIQCDRKISFRFLQQTSYLSI